jgi:uncharacterized protein YacL
LLVPQFVLHELQTIADSPDSLRRQRGRRGLEVLQRIQKLPSYEVRIIDDIPGQTGEVDHKLVELALRFQAKIVTNDFNLNKVADRPGHHRSQRESARQCFAPCRAPRRRHARLHPAGR